MANKTIFIISLSAGLAAFSRGPASASIPQGGEFSLYPSVFSNGAVVDSAAGEFSVSFAVAQQGPAGESSGGEFSAVAGYYGGLGSGLPPTITNPDNVIADAIGPEVSGYRLGVPRSSTVTIQFGGDMLAESFASAIKVTVTRDNDGQQIVSELPTAYSYDAASRMLLVWPATGTWSSNTFHELTLSTSAVDYQGLSMAQALRLRFITMLEASRSNTVVAPDGSASVVLPAGALARDAYLVFTSSPALAPQRVDPLKIQAATAKLQATGGKFSLPYAYAEINAYDAQNDLLSANFARPGVLSLSYPDADSNGLVDSALLPIKQKNSSLYWLDEANSVWVKLPDTGVDTSARRATARVPHLTVFAVIAGADYSAQDVYAYPVPFRPSGPNAGTGAGQTGTEAGGITFMNLPSEADISVFNARGELVWKGRDADGDGKYVWNVKNGDGRPVASGVYFYLVKSAHDSKTGKLVIIR